MASYPRPSRSATPGRNVSISTSADSARARTRSTPSTLRRSATTLRFPRPRKGNAGCRRSRLPSGGSTHTTSAPKSASVWLTCAPTRSGERSTTRYPSSGVLTVPGRATDSPCSATHPERSEASASLQVCSQIAGSPQEETTTVHHDRLTGHELRGVAHEVEHRADEVLRVDEVGDRLHRLRPRRERAEIGVAGDLRVRLVATPPGAMAFTRMASRPSSNATFFVRPISAVFDVP